MSKKLKQAIMLKEVSVRNKTSGEVSVWYRTEEGERRTQILKPFSAQELAPKLVDARYLQFSNLEDLVRRGAVQIL